MEGFKEVIVSQPPAMYNKSNYTTSISLENYKGILLCDRPAGLGGSAAGGSGGLGDAGSKSFAPSNPTGNPVGLGASVESRAHREEAEVRRLENLKKHRAQSNQALTRHRRWLRSFAQQMKQMQEGDREQAVEAARRAARLREAEQQKRQEQQRQLQQQQQELQQQLQQQKAAAEKKAAASKKAAAKPKWAMTEDEALDDELHANDDLLNFAAGLDYDKFVSDMEVREALAVMRDRAAEIARANSWSEDDVLRAAADEEGDDDLASTVAGSEAAAGKVRFATPEAATAAAEARAAAPGGAAAHGEAWDSSSRGRVLKRAISRDALALAERLLAATPSMQKVHTRQSLARVLQRCALQGNTDVSAASLMAMADEKKTQAGDGVAGKTGMDLAAATALGPQPPGAEPKIVHVHPEAAPAGGSEDGYTQPRVLRDMQLSKERTQGLPYLYRCPAI